MLWTQWITQAVMRHVGMCAEETHTFIYIKTWPLVQDLTIMVRNSLKTSYNEFPSRSRIPLCPPWPLLSTSLKNVKSLCDVSHVVTLFQGCVCVFIVSVSEVKLCLGRAGPSLQNGSGLCLMIVSNAVFLNSIWG